MNPDKEHTEYFEQNPKGNHTTPSDETLRFMKRQVITNEKIEVTLTSMEKILAGMGVELKGIHKQTKATNGRVNKNEKAIGSLSDIVIKYKGIGVGGFFVLAAIWALIQFIVPLLIK